MNKEINEEKLSSYTKKEELRGKNSLCTSEVLRLIMDAKEVLWLEFPVFVFASFELTSEFVSLLKRRMEASALAPLACLVSGFARVPLVLFFMPSPPADLAGKERLLERFGLCV